MDSYSYLHTYTYHDKPQFIQSIDLMLSPLRTLFKGKTVNLITGKEVIPGESWVNSPQMRIAAVVATIALSAVFPAFGIAFATTLVLKGICCQWEKKKVSLEISHISDVIETFQENFRSKHYVKALSALELKPLMAPRWRKELLVIGNQLAASANTIEHLPKLCEIYSKNNDSILLFRHIIETKFKKDQVGFDLKHIQQWIKSLQLKSEETLIYCNSILDLFKPEDTDPFLTKMIKLNAGIGIIKIFEELPLSDSETTSNNLNYNFDYLNHAQSQLEKEKNFNGALLRNLLLDNIHTNRSIFIELLDSDNCRHLCYLISAIRNVQNLEADINKVLPQLDKKHFNPNNPVANLKYKKKIIAHAKLFLERIDNLHYKGRKQRKRLPKLPRQLIYFLQGKQENIDSNLEFYRASLEMAEELLTKSEETLKFNVVKFRLSTSCLAKKRYGEIGELYFPPNNHIHELYYEYYRMLRRQFYFIDKVFDLVCLFDDLTIIHQEHKLKSLT